MQRYQNGPTVTCKYSADFRGLVYKVHPHDLSCMYKRMFELCATNTLRDLEAAELLKRIASDFGFSDNQIVTAVDSEKPQIHKPTASSISHLTNDSFTSPSLLGADSNVQTKYINGWETCHRPHSALSFMDHRQYGAYGWKKETRGRSLSAQAKLEYGVKEDRCLHARNYGTQCRKATSSEVIDVSPSMIPSHVSCLYGYTSSQIPYHFKHYANLDNFMDQYRDCYTYKRLEAMKPNINEMRPYQLSLPVSPVLRCFDMFGTIQSPPGIPRMSVSRMHPGRVPPKKQYRKKIIKSPSPDSRAYRQTSSVMAAENGILKMEFQGQPFTQFLSPQVPKTTSSKSSTGAYSVPCLTTVAVNNIKIPVVCRTRPTIPSNARGAIYASSTETPTYVVPYQKDKCQD